MPLNFTDLPFVKTFTYNFVKYESESISFSYFGKAEEVSISKGEASFIDYGKVS